MLNQNMFLDIIDGTIPDAVSIISGGSKYPAIKGLVQFYQIPFGGVLIEAEFTDLPFIQNNSPAFHGLHIHEKGDCSDDFANTGMHYNKNHTHHPAHSGDLLPVLNNNGYSYMVFFDAFLDIKDIIGKSVILHEHRDDFTADPSGNSGEKIACGIITTVKRRSYKDTGRML